MLVNAACIPFFGAVGAAISTLIAEFIVTSIQIKFVRKDFSFKKK